MDNDHSLYRTLYGLIAICVKHELPQSKCACNI